MGKFDGPHFRTEDRVVSVWVAKRPWREFPANNFLEDYESEDDENFNQFSADFGFGYYDHDFAEANGSDNSEELQLSELVARVSYSQSFAGEVLERAKLLGFEKTSYLFLIFEFRYDPALVESKGSDYMSFLGVFYYQLA